MAKNIRWQIPFVSLQGIHYWVYIYDEGEFTPVQLTAGPTPFVTDEDASDDFFCPVRTQTGTLQVCTLKPDGTYITLDELLPENNIARPVRLVNVGTGAIEWQGFLSCEAYSQDYIGIPQIIDLPLISVLEAMDSVDISIYRMTGIDKLHKILYNALYEIDIQSGITNFVHIHYDDLTADVFNKYLDQSNFYEVEEYGGYGQVFATLDAVSCKEVVNRICTFMGWAAREEGTDIYIQRIGSNTGWLRKQTLSSFENGISTYTSESIVQPDMETAFADKWMGAGHKQDFMAGAKSVNVSAKLDSYKLDFSMQECPKQQLVTNPQERWFKWGEFHANSIRDYYNFAFFQSVRFDIVASANHNDAFEAGMTILQSLQYAQTMPWKDVQWYLDMEELAPPTGTKDGQYTDYATAFLTVADGRDCLMVISEPTSFFYGQSSNESRRMDLDDDINPSYYLYKQRSVRTFFAQDGSIKINVQARGLLSIFTGYSNNLWASAVSPQLLVAVQWGDKWAYIDNSGITPTYKWGALFQTFYITLGSNGSKELLFPVSDANNGEITLYIFPLIKGHISGTFSPSGILMDDTISGILLEKFNISYEPPTSAILSDDSDNNYFRFLKTKFKDKIDIGLDIASDLNNNMSPSLLMNDPTTPASTIEMDGENVKPEIDLLDRLSSYYGAARQRLELEVEHPISAPLPLLKLNGINDGKVYLPLSESRDWKTNVCKLTCFETPEEPAES